MSHKQELIPNPKIRQRLSTEWGLAPETIDALLRAANIRSFARGGAIVPQGTSRSTLFIVLAGEVSLSVILPNGQRILCALHHPGAIFGFPIVETERPRWSAAEAFTDAIVAQVGRRDFERIASEISSTTLIRFFNRVVERQAKFGMRLLHCVALDLRGRLAMTLIDLGDTFGVRNATGLLIELPLTHENLAEMVGASRERVSKAMATLMREGLLEYGRGSIVLIDLKGLRNAATPSI